MLWHRLCGELLVGPAGTSLQSAATLCDGWDQGQVSVVSLEKAASGTDSVSLGGHVPMPRTTYLPKSTSSASTSHHFCALS